MLFLFTVHFSFGFSPNYLVIIKQSSFGDDLLCSSSLIALQLIKQRAFPILSQGSPSASRVSVWFERV